jgi:hypothetical protein
MKIPVEAINTPNIWRLGGSTAKLRIYADQPFQTSLGQWWPQGTPGAQNTFYMEVPCTILGGELTIPGFEIDSTVDALVNPHTTYTAELVSANNKRIPFLSHFAVNTLEEGDPSLTWGEITLLREGVNPQSLSDSLIRQLLAHISLAVGELNRASSTNTGVTALTTDPVDPIFPIAVGANDPRWLALDAGTGLIVDSDVATLVDGSVTIPNANALVGSKIIATSMDPNVGGTLHIENIIPGVGFDIASNNIGDNGQVAWILTN